MASGEAVNGWNRHHASSPLRTYSSRAGKEEMLLSQPEQNGFIYALPSDATKTELSTKGRRLSHSGCLRMEAFNLREIPAEAPTLIWYHGGVLTLGSFDDPDGVEAVSSVFRTACTFGESKSGIKHPPALVVGAEYQVPAHPFHAAPIDCLCLASFLLELVPSHWRSPAGGWLAAVAALESFRQFPEQVGR